MGDNLRDELTQAALHMALLTRQPEAGLLHHSDRGTQYTSTEYQAVFARFGIEVSLSRAHNCFDNAPMESVWGKLKTEYLYRYHFTRRTEVRTVIFAYLEGFSTVNASIQRLAMSRPNSLNKLIGQLDLSSFSRPGHES